MFIQVPESVSNSLRNGIAPRTEIHFPNACFENRDPRAVWVDNGMHGSRNAIVGRLECGCGADRVMMPVAGPNWIPWRPMMLPTHENYRRSRDVRNNLLLTPYSSPSRQNITELKTQHAVANKEVEMPAKEDHHSEEDDIESLESPRSFASSGSNSSRDDMLMQFPEMQSPAGRQTQPPVPNRPRSQQPNPWGRASYSDLITMAITSTCNNMMTLSEIYSWIVKNVPYFNDKGNYLSVQGWKNAVRHTLSLRKRFVRVPDPKRPYKSMWTISGDYQRIHLKEKRSHLEDKRSHSKSRRRSTETRQEIRQPMDLDGAIRL